MTKTYHLCISGGNEVLFRSEEDYIRGINTLCLAAHKTESSLLAYSFMSNHVHVGVRTKVPQQLIKLFRYPYGRYFNKKYHRSGSLGEKEPFCQEIDGLYHLLAVLAYILRNPLHHGVAGTPFGYRYSSIGALFKKDLGRFDTPALMPKKSQYLHLPDRGPLPEGFKMDSSGLILPETAIDVADVEHLFSTARSFLFYMNRLSGEAWDKEQQQDSNLIAPVKLEDIERGVHCQDLRTMLSHEHGRADYNALSDLQLCKIIDNFLNKSYCQGPFLEKFTEELQKQSSLPRHLTTDFVPGPQSRPAYSGHSVYTISEKEIDQIAMLLKRHLKLPVEQISRCLGGHDPLCFDTGKP